MAEVYREPEPCRHFESPLLTLEDLHERRRHLQADLADLEARIEGHEVEVCRALRHARRKGIEYVGHGDLIWYERDGVLHSAPCAAAHAVEYRPDRADGRPWGPDDRVGLGPRPTTPLTAGALYGVASADGPGLETLPRWEEEDRSC